MVDKQRKHVLGQVLAGAFKVAEENERLRRGLSYYADPTHWREGLGGEFSLRPPWLKPTQIASKALEFRATYVARPLSCWRSFWRSFWRFVKRRRRMRGHSPADDQAPGKKRATPRAEK